MGLRKIYSQSTMYFDTDKRIIFCVGIDHVFCGIYIVIDSAVFTSPRSQIIVNGYPSHIGRDSPTIWAWIIWRLKFIRTAVFLYLWVTAVCIGIFSSHIVGP